MCRGARLGGMTVELAQTVVGPLTPYALFLTLSVTPGAEREVAEKLADVSGLVRSVGFRAQEGGLTCVTGIGAAFWDAAYAAERPDGLHPFVALDGPQHSAPATTGDVFFHLRATRFDLCFELAHRLVDHFGELVSVEDEVHGFRYFDARDLLGFVDGTENPTGGEAQHFALTGTEDRFPGSSYVIVQKYTHQLDAWHGIGVEAQENAIGRSKLNDLEFPDEDKAPNSHLTLNTVEDDDGGERKILRDNMPFGSVGKGSYGTYFIGYAADVDTTEQMLRNMFLGAKGGVHDRILDFSTALTGALFFVPPQAALDDPELLGGLAADGPERTDAATQGPARGGVLG